MFNIDADICMNCGLCAEYCPFDAIKMDHDYELAAYKRSIYDEARLSKSAGYYASIRPANASREDAARSAKAASRSSQSE
jgi:NADH-quinone oxidoreductase subunit I